MSELQKTREKIETSLAPLEFQDQGFKGKSVEDIDPVELQAELKARMKLLDRLVNEGNNTKDIDEIRAALNAAIKDLGELIEDPALDLLSEEVA